MGERSSSDRWMVAEVGSGGEGKMRGFAIATLVIGALPQPRSLNE
jgi:hypothetical protein